MLRRISFAALILILLCLAGCHNTPTPTIPSTTEPASTNSIVTEPSTTESSVTAPSITEPTATEPPATEPPTTEPTVTEPLATEPSATEPAPAMTGWQEIGDARYYYGKDGKPHTGWLELEGDRYYFLEDGTMARGRVEISDTETRYFTSTGKEVILVNPWNTVPDDYEPELTYYGDYQIAKECKTALEEMLADCKKSGHTAIVVSAYRTHEYQKGLYQRRVQRFLDQGYSREDAEAAAAMRVAIPGTSEHELGLAVDIVDINYQKLTEKQETMPAQQWLMENCWKYGFILRYPNDKSEQTGIIYEPWHYRYVGEELAQELLGTGLCLEEYLQSL